MKKYKIVDNRKELTDEEIEKRMDFSKVKSIMAANQRKSLYQKSAAGLAGLALIISLMVYLNQKPSEQISDTADIVLANNANQPSAFMIDTNKDTTLLYSTGSLITIPANSFVDSAGNKVEGIVELKYREFHNVGEIILAGIPMVFDSAENKYHFESAGMFEINAYQNQAPVFIDKNKDVEIKMVSLNDNKTDFNQYYLDPMSQKWSYTGEDIPSIVSGSNQVERKTGAVGIDLIKPVAKQKNLQQFTVNISYEEFPELMAFDKVLFEVSTETKNFDPSTANVKWDDVVIERIGSTRNYKLEFSNSAAACEIIATPVVEAGDLKKALSKFDQLYNNYKIQSKINENTSKERESKLNKELTENKKAVEYYKELAIANEDKKSPLNVVESERMIYRTFTIKKFGIWNCDKPLNMPQEAIVDATYLTQDGKEIRIASVFLVEKGRNALYTLYNGKKVYFNPENENTLIIITKDNTIGVFSKEQFKALDKETKKFTFKLKMIKKDFYDSSDINSLI